jgi:hypothetical protein
MANILLDVIYARLLDVPYWDVSFVPTEGQLGPWSIKGQSHPPVPEVRYAHDEVFGRIRPASGSLLSQVDVARLGGLETTSNGRDWYLSED